MASGSLAILAPGRQNRAIMPMNSSHTDEAMPRTSGAALRLAWALTLLIAAALCAVTLSSGMPQVGPPGSDKWQHFLGFALLTLPLGYTRPRWWIGILIGAAAFGGMIELIQPRVGRGAEWGDLAADIAGAGSAVIAMRLLRG